MQTIKFLVIAIGIFSSFSILSCKKNDNATPTYFLNATVNGVPFKSTNVAAELKSGAIIVLGVTLLKTDTTGISVAFSQNAKINTQQNFNDPNQSALVYINSKIGIYTTDSTKKASGLYTVTSFNTKDSTVAGTFSGTVVDENGTATITITNGSFYSKISTKSSNSLGLAKPNAILSLNKILFPKL